MLVGYITSMLTMGSHRTGGWQSLEVTSPYPAGTIGPEIIVRAPDALGPEGFRVAVVSEYAESFDDIIEQMAAMGYSLIIGRDRLTTKYVALVYGRDLSEALTYGRWEHDTSALAAAKMALDHVKDIEVARSMELAREQRPDVFTEREVE